MIGLSRFKCDPCGRTRRWGEKLGLHGSNYGEAWVPREILETGRMMPVRMMQRVGVMLLAAVLKDSFRYVSQQVVCGQIICISQLL